MQQRTRLLSPKTFSSFLSNACGLSGAPSPARNEFYHALVEYVSRFPYSRRDKLFKDILEKAHAHSAAITIHLCQNFLLTPDKNLIYPTGAATDDQGRRCFPWQPYLIPDDTPPPGVSSVLLKKYFSAVTDQPRERELLDIPCRPVPPHTILYYGFQSKGDFCQISCDPDTHDFSLKTIPPPSGNVKVLSYQRPPIDVPEATSSLLSHLTGQNIPLANQLFSLFSCLFDPVPGATIVCAPQNSVALTSFLSQAFHSNLCGLTFQIKPAKGGQQVSPLPSLNQIVHASCLRQLYNSQFQGYAGVLVRDLPVADRNRNLVRKLLHGDPIPLASRWLPTQHYRNTLHFICISDNLTRAKRLSKQWKATLIDLSNCELPCTEPVLLSKEDRSWLQTTAVMYGLKLRCGYVPSLPTDESIFDTDDGVEHFLTHSCFIATGAYCNGYELYDAYAAYYRSTHHGRAPLLTKIRFVKRAKQFLGRKSLAHVGYRWLRPRPGAKPRWYFTGLGLPLDPPPPPEPALPEEDPFLSYLKKIHIDLPCPDPSAVPAVRIVRHRSTGPSLPD